MTLQRYIFYQRWCPIESTQTRHLRNVSKPHRFSLPCMGNNFLTFLQLHCFYKRCHNLCTSMAMSFYFHCKKVALFDNRGPAEKLQLINWLWWETGVAFNHENTMLHPYIIVDATPQYPCQLATQCVLKNHNLRFSNKSSQLPILVSQSQTFSIKTISTISPMHQHLITTTIPII